MMQFGRSTVWEETTNIHELRMMVARLLPTLEWRRHGIGLIQAYIFESETLPELRVHIWHPSATRHGIMDHGDIHNHRFELESIVLFGSVFHQEVWLREDPDGSHVVCSCVHAREDIGARYVPLRINQERIEAINGTRPRLRRDLIPPTVEFGEEPTRFSIRTSTTEFSTGHRYRFARGAFHRSFVRDLCVTLVTKRDQGDERALIAMRGDEPPVHAFEANDDFDHSALIQMATNALLSGANR